MWITGMVHSSRSGFGDRTDRTTRLRRGQGSVTELTTLAFMAERTSYRDFACSTAQTLEVVGEWWTLLLVRDAFFGVRRFDDFQRRLGLSRSVLTTRLNRLVEEGILETRQYETRP